MPQFKIYYEPCGELPFMMESFNMESAAEEFAKSLDDVYDNCVSNGSKPTIIVENSAGVRWRFELSSEQVVRYNARSVPL